MQNIFIFIKLDDLKYCQTKVSQTAVEILVCKHLLSRRRFLQGLDIEFISFLFISYFNPKMVK